MVEVLISSICVATAVAGLVLYPWYMDKSLKRLGFRKPSRIRATTRRRDKSHKSLK